MLSFLVAQEPIRLHRRKLGMCVSFTLSVRFSLLITGLINKTEVDVVCFSPVGYVV